MGSQCFNAKVINLNTKINIIFFYIFGLFCINKLEAKKNEKKQFLFVQIMVKAECDMTSFMTFFWFVLSLKKYV